MRDGPDFESLAEGADPAKRERLLRTHELLLAAGPPPELPPSLAEPPPESASRERRPLFTTLPRRRLAAALTVALGVALTAFAIGYLVGADEGPGPAERGVVTIFTLEMKPTKAAPDAVGVLRIGRKEEGGNTPLVLAVSGLDDLGDDGYYELWLTRKGKRVLTCGTFVATDGDLVVRLNAPYTLERFAGWVITKHIRGTKDQPVVLTT
ncbi:MAG: anti-sigma factor [Gaiellaceae bacterium]